MDVIETRGRPKKYDFNLQLGETITQKKSISAQVIALKTAKKLGFKYKTWTIKNKLYIMRYE